MVNNSSASQPAATVTGWSGAASVGWASSHPMARRLSEAKGGVPAAKAAPAGSVRTRSGGLL